jgi:hypothetical protein
VVCTGSVAGRFRVAMMCEVSQVTDCRVVYERWGTEEITTFVGWRRERKCSKATEGLFEGWGLACTSEYCRLVLSWSSASCSWDRLLKRRRKSNRARRKWCVVATVRMSFAYEVVMRCPTGEGGSARFR